MQSEAPKSKLSFAKVAASGNIASPAIARGSALPPTPAIPLPSKVTQPSRTDAVLESAEIPEPRQQDLDKFTPRQAKSTPVGCFAAAPAVTSLHVGKAQTHRPIQSIPVSEENVEKISSMRPPPSTLSFDGKSTNSGTFPLDEKESLRPDDSASVQAGEEDDGQASTQPSSRIGSDSGARVFSEQLREISTMGPPPRQPAAIARMNSANAPSPGVLYAPLPIAVPKALEGVSVSLSHDTNGVPFPPDEKLLEALNSVRDRVWVLKLEQDITDFVKDPSQQMFDLPQCNSFYRMLAHKMADYYFLGHTMDSSLATIRLWKTPGCRIPPRLSEITNPSTAASTPPPPMPQMKILRRNENGTRPISGDGLGEGDSGSDVGRSKFPATREEREARYEAARLRILGSAKPAEDAAAAPPPKDKDESTSSSVVGKRKTRKQRTDSEDGFEARSAFSMYAPGSVAQIPKPQAFPSENTPMHSGLPAQYSMAPFGNAYGPPMDPTQAPPPWQPQPHYSGPPRQAQAWSQDQYGGYNLAYQMQGMSFQRPGMVPVPSYPGSAQIGSPSQIPAYPAYPVMPPAFQDPYPGSNPPQSFQNGHLYPYGMLPAQGNGGKRPNPDHPLPGSFNRQYFNPQSQAFVPTESNLPCRPPFAGPYSPAMPNASLAHNGPQHLQRQPSSHSNLNGSPHLPVLTQPNPHTLTHPLPQPVYTSNGPQPNLGQHGGKQSPLPTNGSVPRESSIAKFAAPSLPAKPPPPINDAARFQQSRAGPGPLDASNMNGRKASPRTT